MKAITRQEIKRKLAKHYSGDTERHMRLRELYETKNMDNYAGVGSIFFSLTGSPPKGYGIYIPNRRRLSLYDGRGKRFRIIDSVELVEKGGEADGK